jgi:hypothetical protein
MKTNILSKIRDNKEVVITGSPIKQMDAKNQRYKIVIYGPKQLLAPLMHILTDNDKI